MILFHFAAKNNANFPPRLCSVWLCSSSTTFSPHYFFFLQVAELHIKYWKLVLSLPLCRLCLFLHLFISVADTDRSPNSQRSHSGFALHQITLPTTPLQQSHNYHVKCIFPWHSSVYTVQEPGREFSKQGREGEVFSQVRL